MHFGAGYGYSRFMTDDHKRHSHDHDHSHDSHSHSLTHTRGFFSSHNHAVANYGRAFAVGITLNLIFVLIEAGYGFFSNSLALLSDAGHNLSDVLGLFLAWFATWLARRRSTAQFTYGFRSSSILAAVINAVALLVAVVGIIWEAVVRFSQHVTRSVTRSCKPLLIGSTVRTDLPILKFHESIQDLSMRMAN